MKSINKDIRDFICLLAEKHRDVRHRQEECHFACSLDEANNRYATVMCYPCVCLDCGDILVSGSASQKLIEREYTLFFLHHVADSADSECVNSAFDLTEHIMLDFLAKLDYCKASNKYPFLRRLSVNGSYARRIEYEKNSLYGWAVTVKADSLFCNLDCDDAFDVLSSEEGND